MNADELIAYLQELPAAQRKLPVGYVNRCADDGADFITIDQAEVRAGQGRGYGSCSYPDSGVLVLE